MLFRKRAWDLMRDDFATVDEAASLAEAVRALRASQKKAPENNVVLVMGKSGGKDVLKGVVSVWTVLAALDENVLRDPELKVAREGDFDKAFARASAVCTHTPLDTHMEPDVPTLKPNDPMPVVLELFLRRRRGWAVVQENGKVLGVILVADLYRELSGDIAAAL
ncbi:CBS domain-containing protein [Humidesulfovibrio mexicanus]|jgi:CBS domain-containing protein|uniref:CBS domain-containing protein n=1 Tax=Humidesulfovibrio mexicanus TaxID=147047 RepID=A0A239ANJ0_9BACT|nr:CBS domain-containing protein [Humidesulfovibrio mexicanus]SNR96614.1 CBS domain-containing protein [Humidesulfovibrio mexicanus]